MAVPVYIVSGPAAGATPVTIVSTPNAVEVIVVGGPRQGGQAVFVVGADCPDAIPVRMVGTARTVSGTLA